MSTLTLYNIACKTFATLFLLLGVAILLLGVLLIYLSIFGVTDWYPIFQVQALLGVNLRAFEKFGAFGAFLLLIAVIPIVLGVLAYRHYVWAMIIGTFLFLLSYLPAAVRSDFAELTMHKFEIIGTLIFFLLTVVAIRCCPAPALAGASH
jgi:hypothetical protein